MTELETLCRSDSAEESLQEPFAAAAQAWQAGPPRNPHGWLYGTARHKAIDRLRRQALLEKKLAEQGPLQEIWEESGVPDERLRLIFTCCHPTLAVEAQVAQPLRTLCGLTTEEIAHAFLVPPATLAQRLVRAKAKIRDAGIPYAVPSEGDLPDRLEGDRRDLPAADPAASLAGRGAERRGGAVAGARSGGRAAAGGRARSPLPPAQGG